MYHAGHAWKETIENINSRRLVLEKKVFDTIQKAINKCDYNCTYCLKEEDNTEDAVCLAKELKENDWDAEYFCETDECSAHIKVSWEDKEPE